MANMNNPSNNYKNKRLIVARDNPQSNIRKQITIISPKKRYYDMKTLNKEFPKTSSHRIIKRVLEDDGVTEDTYDAMAGKR